MKKTIAFHLQKGGVGKTTVSGALACQSAINGHPTVYVDVDPQGNASSWFLKKGTRFEFADVLQGEANLEDVIVEASKVKNLFLIPTFGVGGSLKNYSETRLAEEPYVIQDLIGELSKDFDRIILDLSPGFGRLEKSALIACDEVITPMTPEFFSVEGLEIFINEIQKTKKNFRSNVKHFKVVINAFEERIKQHRDIFNSASEGQYKVYKIPVDPVFRKSQEDGTAPQLYKSLGRGLKSSTREALEDLEFEIWR